MKIAIDASRYKAVQPTGVERYSYEIINAVLHEFWQDKDNQFLLYSPREFTVHGAGSVRFRKRIIPFKRLWTQIRLSWAMLIERPDVLFVPSHVLPLICPKKSVITIHDVAFLYEKRAYSFFQNWYLRWSTRFAVKKAAKIIVPSMAVKKDLVKFFNCKSGKIEVVHHGCVSRREEIAKEEKDEQKLRKFFKRFDFDPEEDDFMLFVGRLESKKNLVRVIKAFKKFSQHHPNWRLVLAGKPGVGYRKVIKAFFKSKLGEKIVVPGFVTEQEKDFLFRKCQFVVFPSLHEGFGFPALTAFDYEKPVILSEIPVFKEVAQQAGYYVDPHKIEEISHGMMELAANEKMGKMLVGKGKDRLKQFSWEKAGRQTAKILRDLT